jgi:RNA polymerase sigma-54 factor
MQTSLQFGLNQQLKMTPQLQQAIKLLQMSSLELEREIQTRLESNLLLEQVEANDTDVHEESNFLFSQFSGENWDRGCLDKSREFLLQKSAETTLREHLYWQMELAPFSEKDKIIATTLIDAISEEGYLLCPLSEIQESLNFKPQPNENEIETVLCRIQQFDPLGVGARNLSECLNIQLNSLPIATPWMAELKLLVSEHLEILGKRDYARLKTKLHLNSADLKDTIKILTSLNPRPGTQLSTKKSEYIMPDVIVHKKNNQCIIELNNTFIQKLRINTHYANLIQQKKTAGNNIELFKTHLKEAKYFLKALQTRNQTLLKVAACILNEQKDFLDFGEEKMRPLSLQDIARKTDLHESTISRITTKKHILTPRGIFELKYFFSNAIISPQGKGASTIAIRALIKKIIAQETSQAPLSDHKITELLLECGIAISRRTVTKYREAMHVPTSNERKTSVLVK